MHCNNISDWTHYALEYNDSFSKESDLVRIGPNLRPTLRETLLDSFHHLRQSFWLRRDSLLSHAPLQTQNSSRCFALKDDKSHYCTPKPL